MGDPDLPLATMIDLEPPRTIYEPFYANEAECGPLPSPSDMTSSVHSSSVVSTAHSAVAFVVDRWHLGVLRAGGPTQPIAAPRDASTKVLDAASPAGSKTPATKGRPRAKRRGGFSPAELKLLGKWDGSIHAVSPPEAHPVLQVHKLDEAMHHAGALGKPSCDRKCEINRASGRSRDGRCLDPHLAAATVPSFLAQLRAGVDRFLGEVEGLSCERCDRSERAPPVIVYEDDEYDRFNVNGSADGSSSSNGFVSKGTSSQVWPRDENAASVETPAQRQGSHMHKAKPGSQTVLSGTPSMSPAAALAMSSCIGSSGSSGFSKVSDLGAGGRAVRT